MDNTGGPVGTGVDEEPDELDEALDEEPEDELDEDPVEELDDEPVAELDDELLCGAAETIWA